MKSILKISVLFCFMLFVITNAFSQDKKSMTLDDVMKFRQIQHTAISQDGKWIALTSAPDRGDPDVLVYSADAKVRYTISGAEKPLISNDGLWVAAGKVVGAEETEKKKEGDESLKAGLFLLNTKDGKVSTFEDIQHFSFSNDSRWIFIHDAAKKGKSDKGKAKKADQGSLLKIISLLEHDTLSLPFVSKFASDSLSHYLAYSVLDTCKENKGLFILNLEEHENKMRIAGDSSTWIDNLTWNNSTGSLAFLSGIQDEKKGRLDAALFDWMPGDSFAEMVLSNAELDENWKIYHRNNLRWSKDGQRLFLGLKPDSEIIIPENEDADTLIHLFDTEQILAKRGVDVWHWNDPYINPHQKIRWKTEKDRTYAAVFYPEHREIVLLADEDVPEVRIDEMKNFMLASSNIPYAKMLTWERRFRDYYLADLKTGKKEFILEKQEHDIQLSPDGKYTVYYRDGDWFLRNNLDGNVRNLTKDSDHSFADEDWDYPADTPGYGIGGWIGESFAVLIYDKYDIWQFSTSGAQSLCLTDGKGRSEKMLFRIKELDTDARFFEEGETLFLSAYHDLEKYTAIYKMKAGRVGLEKVLEGPKKYRMLSKAKDADKLLFTRESYTEFPDLYLTDLRFRNSKKLTDFNQQVKGFAWGEAELVEWSSIDGVPLQGILIKPGNYVPGKRYPVLVYYYRFFTDRMYDFPTVAINHRPCFPFYASNDYAIFLPDIRFDIGTPGASATKCLVPGVQKIIDMGIANPDAIALHGHSWSGYQTAFVITQSDMFACAIAGAPVSNMTSAYSGIRWGSGMARQFQYEQSQSRIGGDLWEARDKYIENSPVFFADRISTPLLIEFGDIDDAVPWYQGIELYLAMRRLGKECIFLQYRGEPHHLKKYANKLDYTIRFKEYLDHYLKGEPAADWIINGELYEGK